MVISFEIGQKNDKKEQIQQKGAVMAVRMGGVTSLLQEREDGEPL